MNLLLVAVAFASFSAVQDDPRVSPLDTGGSFSSQPRETPDAPSAESAPAARESSSSADTTGATGAGAASQAPEGAATPGERQICRRIPISGTHRYRRVCQTADQWRRWEQ